MSLKSHCFLSLTSEGNPEEDVEEESVQDHSHVLPVVPHLSVLVFSPSDLLVVVVVSEMLGDVLNGVDGSYGLLAEGGVLLFPRRRCVQQLRRVADLPPTQRVVGRRLFPFELEAARYEQIPLATSAGVEEGQEVTCRASSPFSCE